MYKKLTTELWFLSDLKVLFFFIDHTINVQQEFHKILAMQLKIKN